MPEGTFSDSPSSAMRCASPYLNARAAEWGSVESVQSLKRFGGACALPEAGCPGSRPTMTAQPPCTVNSARVDSDWQPQGVCFHLYSKARSSGLAEYQLPELQRSPLDELSLQARLPAARHQVSLLLWVVYTSHLCTTLSVFHDRLSLKASSYCKAGSFATSRSHVSVHVRCSLKRSASRA